MKHDIRILTLVFLLIWATRLWIAARKEKDEVEKPPEDPKGMK